MQLHPALVVRQITIVYMALLLGQIIFGVILFLVTVPESLQTSPSLRTTLLVVVTAVALVSITAVNLLFTSKLESIRKLEDETVRLRRYLTLNIVRYASYEAPTLIALAGYTITSSALFLGIAFLLIALFITIRPTSAKLSSDIQVPL